ncbi:MAG: PIN domain-containing protein [Candidatus Berkelbacteria bacterium]|nr:PIN domain-containing protein [Candidatus Berkelbacteria bacterium]
MPNNISVYLDSDVVISSMLSKTGAANMLVNEPSLIKIVSNYSLKELKIVAERLQISQDKLKSVTESFTVITLSSDSKEQEKDFRKFVTDPGDTHIIAGAKKSGVRFLLTYNQKHFITNSIKNDLGVIVLTPARFVQYWRSLSN